MPLTVLGSSTSLPRVGNGNGAMPLIGTRDGALHVADYILARAMEGRVFHTAVGSLTAPTTFRGTTGLVVLQPELVIDVPVGTTIIPVEIRVYLEDSAGTDNEILAVTSTALRGAGTSTAGSALSTRTSRDVSSGCSIYYTYSGNAVALSGTVEFWRAGYPFADATTDPIKMVEYNIRKNTPQVIQGAGSVSIYIGAAGTAPAGFVTATWIELPSTGI